MDRFDPSTSDILDALSVTPEPTGPTIERRRFLQGAAATGATLALPMGLADIASAQSVQPIGARDGIAVIVTMGGGNDGLNTVAPIGDGAYHDARPRLGLRGERALPIIGDRAFHPNLPLLKQRWDRGDVAVIDGVGHPTIELSHFTSMYRWMTGHASDRGNTGWLGRYLDGLGGAELSGVTIGNAVPLNMIGRNGAAVSLPTGAWAVPDIDPSDAIRMREYAAMRALGAGPSGYGDLGDALSAAHGPAIDLATAIRPVYDRALPAGKLAEKLELCARLINSNVGLRVLHVKYGDFDSHSGQPTMHDARMAELDEGIQRFFDALAAPWLDQTVVLCVSEFGRRVKENRSSGTDHGRANTLLAIGAGVRGGFHGEMPSLTRLDETRNLIPTVDFRSVYASLLDTWLDGDPEEILGGAYERLDLFDRPGEVPPSVPPGSVSVKEMREQVIRLYLAYFGRTPDNTGLEFWTKRRRDGSSLSSVSEQFARSGEFQTRYGNVGDTAFVELVYENVMGRGADAGGRDYWTGRLAAGVPRGAVMAQFSESDEYRVKAEPTVDDVNGNGAIARLYLAYFERRPDAGGLEFFLTRGYTAEQVSNTLVRSDEFQQRYGALDDVAFVDLVYANVLGRSPDAAGRSYWIDQLRGGLSRARVMLAFSESREFIRATGTRA